MHLYQSSLEGHESREEAKWAPVPTLFLGQNGGPSANKNIYPPPPPLSSCHVLTFTLNSFVPYITFCKHDILYIFCHLGTGTLLGY